MAIKIIILGLMCVAAFILINNILHFLLVDNLSMTLYLKKIAAFKL